jgi:hypothetical protein
VQAAFQAAVSDTRRISQSSLRDACETRSRRNTCELREWPVRRRPERPPARSKASSWLESRMWGKMASCCRLVIGLYEVFIPFHGPKAHADRQDCLPHETPNPRAPSKEGSRQRAFGGAPAQSTSIPSQWDVLCNAYFQLFPMAGRGQAFCCCALERQFPLPISVSQARPASLSNRSMLPCAWPPPLVDSFCSSVCGRRLPGSPWPSMSYGSLSPRTSRKSTSKGFTSCWPCWPRR